MDWLKEILNNAELSAEQKQEAILKELPKHFKPADLFNERNERVKELETQLTDRDKQLEELKKNVKGNEELTTKITELTELNKKTKEDFEERIKKQEFDFKLTDALRDAKVKNPKALKALLDINNIKLDGEKLLGLDDQLKTLKESDSYLFEEEQAGGTGGAGNFGRKGNETKNPWSKEHFNLTEQGRLYRENPELAKQLEASAKN